MREPIAAGLQYEAEARALQTQIDDCYTGERGPGALPCKDCQSIKAILVPVSPYKNAGQCMAWAYKALAESPLPDVYIIIAEAQGSGISLTNFNTPFGPVRIDQELGKALLEKGSIALNEELHAKERAIEVQLPFLLHARRQDAEHVKILPVLVSRDIDIQALALDLEEALIDLKRTPVFICSTNLLQYGPLFHHVPFTLEAEKTIKEWDKAAMDMIVAHDIAGFLRVVEEKLMNINTAAIALLLRTVRGKARIEQYYTSGDLLGDYKNSVSYAAIVFE